MYIIREFLKYDAFWTILGVVLGFCLGELTAVLKDIRSRRKIMRSLKDELQSNVSIIAQKQDIIDKMIGALQNKQILEGQSLHAASLIYDVHLPLISKLLTPIQRDNLHVIYESLKVIDKFLDEFEKNTKEDIDRQIMPDPWGTYQGKLGDLREKYNTLRSLIADYLNNKPRDVFCRHTRQKSRQQDFQKPQK